MYNFEIKVQLQKPSPALELLGCLLDLEEPSLKMKHSTWLLPSNSSPMSNSRHFEIGHHFLLHINYNIHSTLWLHVGMHIICISDFENVLTLSIMCHAIKQARCIL